MKMTQSSRSLLAGSVNYNKKVQLWQASAKGRTLGHFDDERTAALVRKLIMLGLAPQTEPLRTEQGQPSEATGRRQDDLRLPEEVECDDSNSEDDEDDDDSDDDGWIDRDFEKDMDAKIMAIPVDLWAPRRRKGLRPCAKSSCNKAARMGPYCSRHGGRARCIDPDCNKHAPRLRNYCRTHARARGLPFVY